jgi:hypothetical protein
VTNKEGIANWAILNQGDVPGKVVRILHSISGFRVVSYNTATEAVMPTLAGKPTFPRGGQVAVLAGVTGISGLELGGNTVFTISAKGRNIAPS